MRTIAMHREQAEDTGPQLEILSSDVFVHSELLSLFPEPPRAARTLRIELVRGPRRMRGPSRPSPR